MFFILSISVFSVDSSFVSADLLDHPGDNTNYPINYNDNLDEIRSDSYQSLLMIE